MATATMSAPPAPLTAEQFAQLPDDGRHTELVKGVAIEMPPPSFQHREACANIAGELR